MSRNSRFYVINYKFDFTYSKGITCFPQLAGFAAAVAQNVATKNKEKDAKVLWNSIKQKIILPKMNLVNSRGVLDQKVNYLKEYILLLVLILNFMVFLDLFNFKIDFVSNR